MADTLTEDAIVRALKTLALLKAHDAATIEPLPGRTWKVCADGRQLLVRSADKESCAAAQVYATIAARHVPDFPLKILGHDAGILVEEWRDPGEYKSLAQEVMQELSAGYSTPFDDDEVGPIDLEIILNSVGEKIGTIHTGTRSFVQGGNDATAPAPQARPPDTYLAAARAHPHLANRLRGIAATSARVEPVLLHGRLSSAVLFGKYDVAVSGPDRMASGDPARDLAQMMAHLFVASVHQGSSILVTTAGAFHAGYASTIEAPDKLSLMYRAGPLCVAFMLAFLDDEQVSPVLTAKDKDVILDFSQWWLGRRDYTLGQVRYALWDAVDAGGAIDWREKFQSLARADG